MQAVSDAGKTEVESFNNLDKEAKENLFKKYSAAVDMAAQEVEIKQAINSELAGISADRVAARRQALGQGGAKRRDG